MIWLAIYLQNKSMKQKRINTSMLLGNKRGFTLLEIVITMQIVVTILFISTFVFQRTMKYLEEELFIETFQMTARATQQKAIARQKKTKVVWDTQKQSYLLPCSPYPETELKLPASMEAVKVSTLEYSPKGISPLYAIDFASDRYLYHFQWQMGAGKYRYEKKKREQKARDVFE